MNVASLFSGGKDSTYAVHWAKLKGLNVKCLITIEPARQDSWMFHRPLIELTKVQAKLMNIPQIYVRSSEGVATELFILKQTLSDAISKYDIEGIVTGALLSDYQRMRINFIAEELGLPVYSPLWRKDQAEYMRELVRDGFKFIITSISVMGLSRDFIGKIVDEYIIERIIEVAERYGFNPAFEGGEAETLVVEAPLFKGRIIIKDYNVASPNPYSFYMSNVEYGVEYYDTW
ncbi:MAG: diphthine--ammonia ligase [Candidatus Aenigmatarchaeota archaeon]|nr:MAG: diphthine--ammonia ligase [Candidatus Aenigmarchaeota archaeon]